MQSLIPQRWLAALQYSFLLAMLAVIAGILTTAMVLQYVNGELPCPLCLLERLALFGVCFGILQNFRDGFSDRNTGISLIFATLLLIISTRQSLLDIYPRPGHAYIGSAVFGIHMPVWSILIALCLILAFAAKLALLGGTEHLRDNTVASFPLIARVAEAVGLFLLALCAINLVSVVVQCGFGQCHTMGYDLLK